MHIIRITDILKIARHGESGMMLLETLAATAIVGLVAVSILGGLSVAAKSDFTLTKLSSAEALASSQMEHIKYAAYIDYSAPGHGEYELISATTGYEIEVTCMPISPITGQPLGVDEDIGIQMITVLVRHNGEQSALLNGYKIDR